jgi:NADH-quinone oxidoreductase subunit G
MSNEDLYVLRKLVHGLGGTQLGVWPPTHAGADIVAQVGVGKGTNLSDLGPGDAVLVIATDLEEEAPIWRLRIKQAKDRGALVVVANARPTRMDAFATAHVRYEMGHAAAALQNLRTNDAALAEQLFGANNLIIVAGAEGLTLQGSRALMQTAANLLIETGHVGKPNNGLLGVFPGANGMGLHYTGFSPEATEAIAANPPRVLIVAQAEILADDPAAAAWLDQVETVICLSLFPDELTARAHIALPIQSFAERDGTFTNGERRVQRFYTAQGPMGEALPAWQVLSRLAEKAGQGKAYLSAAVVMLEMTQQLPAFAGMRYSDLARVERQYPEVGGEDLYFGGTSYKNQGGLGVQAATAADRGEAVDVGQPVQPTVPAGSGFRVVPTTRLYNRERVMRASERALLRPRIAQPYVEINAADAARLKISDGDLVSIETGGNAVQVRAHVNGAAPEGSVLLPRHLSEAAVPLTIAVGQVSKV